MAKKIATKNVLTLAVKPPNAPNEKIIDLLREALKDAKAGKIHAIGIALGTIDEGEGSDAGRCTETVLSASDGWHHTLSTAVSGLAFRLHHERYTQGSAIPPAKLDETDE
jgi:hypothetical protein